eukprot:1150696-Pelagomonas_calceolata.AAC.1
MRKGGKGDTLAHRAVSLPHLVEGHARMCQPMTLVGIAERSSGTRMHMPYTQGQRREEER